MQKHGIVRVGDEAIGSRVEGLGLPCLTMCGVRVLQGRYVFGGYLREWKSIQGLGFGLGLRIWVSRLQKIGVEGQVLHSKAQDSTLQEIQVNVGSLCAH